MAADKLTETDHLKLQLLLAQRGRLDAEYQAQVLHLQIQQAALMDHIARTYEVSGSDELDATTGAIKRKPKE